MPVNLNETMQDKDLYAFEFKYLKQKKKDVRETVGYLVQGIVFNFGLNLTPKSCVRCTANSAIKTTT